MQKHRSERSIYKWKRILLVLLASVVLVPVLIIKFVNRIPEKKLARNFLLQNEVIETLFGPVISMTDGTNGSSVSYSKSILEGYYSFYIEGKKKSGQVVIQWHSKGSGIGFGVDTVEFLEPFKEPVLIWSSKQEHK